MLWEPEPVSGVEVDALLAGPSAPRERDEQTDAEHVIRDLLDGADAWPMEARAALAAGAAQGIHARTMQRTAQRLGIRITRTGFGRVGRWVWHRPHIGDNIEDSAPGTAAVSSMSSMQKQVGTDNPTHIDDTRGASPARDAERSDGAAGTGTEEPDPTAEAEDWEKPS